MPPIQRVLSIQDFCCVGRCALVVTLPVLATLGIQTIPLPTAIFSNQPQFPSIFSTSMTDSTFLMMDCWDELHLEVDAIQTGFLASPDQTKIVKNAIERYATPSTLIVIDPAMADHGVMYKGFDSTMVQAMKELLREATITTPNYTEALLLTNEPYKEDPPTWDTLRTLCEKLALLGPPKVVITSVPAENNKIRTAVFDTTDNSFTAIDTPRIDFRPIGTGDMFTAILTGRLLGGDSLVDSTEKSVRFIYKCVKYAASSKTDPRHGIPLEAMLPELLTIRTPL